MNLIRHVRNWPAYLAYKHLGINADDGRGFVFATTKGRVDVPKELLHTFKECFFDANGLKHLPKELLEMESPVLVDVGANVGYFSLFALGALKHPTIYSYEPMPANFKLMQTYRDSVGDPNWHIENKAIAGRPGVLTLHYNAADSFTTTATLFARPGEPDVAEVECETIASMMRRLGLDHIDILKLDCEGAEFAIVYETDDETLKKVRSFTIEVHEGSGENENRQALQAYLSKKGFRTCTEKSNLLWAWRC